MADTVRFEPVDIIDHLEHARWKIGCVNWGAPDHPDLGTPRALVYLWCQEHELMLIETYLPTVEQGIAYVSAIIPKIQKAVAAHA